MVRIFGVRFQVYKLASETYWAGLIGVYDFEGAFWSYKG